MLCSTTTASGRLAPLTVATRLCSNWRRSLGALGQRSYTVGLAKRGASHGTGIQRLGLVAVRACARWVASMASSPARPACLCRA